MTYLISSLYQKKPDGSDENEEKSQGQRAWEEFKEYMAKLKVKEFKCREMSMKYAFEREDTPTEAQYLQVRYAATDPPVEADYSGPNIEAVFGTTVNSLELLLIERNLKGPCWLDVKAPLPVDNAFSWCKVQVRIEDFLR